MAEPTNKEKRLEKIKKKEIQYPDGDEIPIRGKRKRKKFPPHFAIRSYSFWNNEIGYWVYPHPQPKGASFFPKYKVNLSIQEKLQWWAEEFPETAIWPVRFIGCPPVEVGREVIE